jgi:hypothetical protein
VTDAADLDPPTSRLGLLQRGRGAGCWRAQQDGAAAHDDLLRCVLADPRFDAELEARERYFAELAVPLALPIEPLVSHLRQGPPGQLGHGVLAGMWRLGHAGTRDLLAAADTEAALVAGVVQVLWAQGWATAVQLAPRAATLWLRCAREHADCTVAQLRVPRPTELAGLATDQLLDLARDPRDQRRDRLLGELCQRGDEATRARLLATLTDDIVYDRVRLAARALGLLDDERPLPLAEALFAREDVFAEPARRLPAAERMRRTCLADYVLHLPAARSLPLARRWRGRGGFFEVVAGGVFRDHATAADRDRLEAFVAEHQARDGGYHVIDELDALARLGDARSVQLLVEVAHTAAYSQARRRAVAALAVLPEHPAAQAVLREALWDCEDETAAAACSFLPALDGLARDRVAVLSGMPLAAAELRERAARRLRRPGRGQDVAGG